MHTSNVQTLKQLFYPGISMLSLEVGNSTQAGVLRTNTLHAQGRVDVGPVAAECLNISGFVNRLKRKEQAELLGKQAHQQEFSL